MPGPLAGTRVVELQGRGPGPFGAMLLADLGADVVRIARPDAAGGAARAATEGATAARDAAKAGAAAGAGVAEDPPRGLGGDNTTERMIKGDRRIDLLARSRRSVAIDLKRAEGLAAAQRLIDRADVLVEGYRPGVADRLGLGPDVCLERNPRLVYARITGWGQDGPYAPTPGHDINYGALAGALHPLRRPGEAPAPPLDLLGDFGGGGMLLAVAVLSALVERARSGVGQVVDAAMVDGVALLTTLFHGLRAEGLWSDEPGAHVLDLGAPFYNVYETADGGHVTVGSGEPQFYAELVEPLGLDGELPEQQGEPATRPAGKDRLCGLGRAEVDALRHAGVVG